MSYIDPRDVITDLASKGLVDPTEYEEYFEEPEEEDPNADVWLQEWDSDRVKYVPADAYGRDIASDPEDDDRDLDEKEGWLGSSDWMADNA